MNAEEIYAQPQLLCASSGEMIIIKTPFGAAFIAFANFAIGKRFLAARYPGQKDIGFSPVPELDASWREKNESVPIVFFGSAKEIDAWSENPSGFDYAAHRSTLSVLAKTG